MSVAIEPHSADIEQTTITIYVNERFPAQRLNSPYVITDTNIVYDVGTNNLFMYIQPGHNYTVISQRTVAKSLRRSGSNGTIVAII